jgi:hypothetical protein
MKKYKKSKVKKPEKQVSSSEIEKVKAKKNL